LDVHTVATGPVAQSLTLAYSQEWMRYAGRSPWHDPQLDPNVGHLVPLCLFFDARASHTAPIAITLSELSLTIHAQVEAPYLAVSFTPGSVPEPSLPSATSASANLLGQTQSLKPRDPVLVLSTQRTCGSSNPHWDLLPQLLISNCSRAALAYGTLSIRVHEGAGSKNTLVASVCIPFHALWAAVAESEARPHRFNADVSNVSSENTPAALSASIAVASVPSTSQMVTGVTSSFGILGGRPVVIGEPLPVSAVPISSGVAIPSVGQPLPLGWIELVDSFGYTYWHNRHAPAGARDSWVCPDASGSIYDPDEDLKQVYRVDRISSTCFRSRVDGAESWIHPRAIRASGLPRTSHESTDSLLQLPWPADVQSVPASSTQQSFKADIHPATTASAAAASSNKTAVRATEDEETSPTRILMSSPSGGPIGPITDNYGCATEMRWTRHAPLLSESGGACPATEGHTLTKVCGKLLLFGGSLNNMTRINDVHELDERVMRWSAMETVGAKPVGRVGHGAVAIGGGDASKLFVFGGTSSLGRLNDINGKSALPLVQCIGINGTSLLISTTDDIASCRLHCSAGC
jgi:hypothetical protein